MNSAFEKEHDALKEVASKKILKLGLGFAGLMLLVQIIIVLTNNTSNFMVMAIPEFILIAAIITILIVYRQTLKGVAFFGELFSAGFKTTALITLIMVAWIFISYLLFPDLKSIDVANAKLSMEAQKIPAEEIQKNLALYDDNKVYFLGKVFNVIRLDFILGILITVIIAMFMRTKSQD